MPSFIVMLDEGNDDYTEATLAIRIKVVTYDPGTIETTGAITPNVEGYKDLLNAITRIRIAISENRKDGTRSQDVGIEAFLLERIVLRQARFVH